MADEVDRLLGGVDKLLRSGAGIHADKIKGYDREIDADMVAMKNRVTNTLNRIQAEAERGWVEASRGRLNVTRHIQGLAMGRQTRTPFDAWEDDSDGLSVNMAVLLDISGSIVNADEVARTGWILKSAIDGIDGRCEVISFNTVTNTVYSGDARASRTTYMTFNAGGGTDPTTALEYASGRLLAGSEGIPVLVMVTDGMWQQSKKGPTHESMIGALNDAGVTTVLYGLAHAVSGYGGHGCQIAADIDGIGQMVPLVEKIVARIMVDRIVV